MNELMYNFINQIEDINSIKEMTVEEFTKLVKSNHLISSEDAKSLIESFQKISSKKNSDDDSNDSDSRKKKYREQHKEFNQQNIDKKEIVKKEEKEDTLER